MNKHFNALMFFLFLSSGQSIFALLGREEVLITLIVCEKQRAERAALEKELKKSLDLMRAEAREIRQLSKDRAIDTAKATLATAGATAVISYLLSNYHRAQGFVVGLLTPVLALECFSLVMCLQAYNGANDVEEQYKAL